jgi:hypothetical protein
LLGSFSVDSAKNKSDYQSDDSFGVVHATVPGDSFFVRMAGRLQAVIARAYLVCIDAIAHVVLSIQNARCDGR